MYIDILFWIQNEFFYIKEHIFLTRFISNIKNYNFEKIPFIWYTRRNYLSENLMNSVDKKTKGVVLLPLNVLDCRIISNKFEKQWLFQNTSFQFEWRKNVFWNDWLLLLLIRKNWPLHSMKPCLSTWIKWLLNSTETE